MHAKRDEVTKTSWPTVDVEPQSYHGPPRNLKSINEIEWDEALQPKKYEIFGTHPESRILFLDVNILDSTGNEPFRGDVLIEGTYHEPGFRSNSTETKRICRTTLCSCGQGARRRST